MENRKLKIGLVGCGGIANCHVNGFRELYSRGLKIFDIIATVDINEENAMEKAKQVGFFQGKVPKVYTSIDSLISNEDIDAVDICLPHNLHHKVAKRFLAEGVDVIIEKPLGITMRTARIILDSAKKNNRVLAVAENYRRSIENRVIWWSIRKGLIGKPRMVLWYEAGWNPNPWGWREDKFVAGGSWVFDGGVHLADLDRYHLGKEAVEVYAVTRLYEPIKKGVKINVDDMTMAILKYEDDISVQWLWTRVAPAKHLSMRIIYGSKGAISCEGVRSLDEGDGIKEISMNSLRSKMFNELDKKIIEKWFPNDIYDTFASELYDFYIAVTEKDKPEVDGWEAYRDMAIPLAFYESSYLDKPVLIKDVENLTIENYQKEINEKIGI